MCSKSYTSSTRYESHLRRCELRPASRQSSRQSSRRSSVSRSDISDVERDSKSKEDYYVMIKKLSADRSLLKNQVKKYADELKKRVDDIGVLITERDQLTKDLSAMEKKRESRSVIKKLEKTIMTLQERLTVQKEDADKARQTMESHFKSQEAKIQEQLKSLLTKEQKLNTDLEHERKSLQQLRETYRNERANIRNAYDEEKQQQLNDILADKHKICSDMEKKIRDMTDNFETERKKHFLELRQLRSEIATEKEKASREINKVKATFGDAIERERQQMQSRIVNIQEKHAVQLQQLEDKYIADIKLEKEKLEKTEQRAVTVISNRDMEIENLRNENAKKIEEIERMYKEKIEKSDQLTSTQFETRINAIKEQYERKYKQLQSKAESTIEQLSRQVGGLTDSTEKLRHDAEHYKNMANRLKENNQLLNKQFTVNMARQTEDNQKLVDNRDKKILELEKELGNVRKDNYTKSEYISRVENRIVQLDADNKNFAAQNEEITKMAKDEVNRLHETIDAIKEDCIEKLQAETEKVNEVRRQMSLDRDERVNAISVELEKVNRELEDERKKCKHIQLNALRSSAESTNMTQVLQNQVNSLERQVVLLEEEKQSIASENMSLKKVIVQMRSELSKIINDFDKKLIDQEKQRVEMEKKYNQLLKSFRDYEEKTPPLMEMVKRLSHQVNEHKGYKEKFLIHEKTIKSMEDRLNGCIKTEAEASCILLNQKQKMDAIEARNRQLEQDIKEKEELLAEKIKECDNVKNGCMQTMNKQSISFRVELSKKDSRIRELENAITAKLK